MPPVKRPPLEVRAVPVGPFVMNCYIVRDPDTGRGILVDPGDSELSRIQKEIGRSKTDVVAAVGTHGHLDHVGQTAKLKEALKVPFFFHRRDQPLLETLDEQARMFGLPSMETPQVDRYLEEADEIVFGSKKLRIVHAPGHSPGSVCLVGEGVLFSGDVLFQGSVGRTDLWGGNYETLIGSIKGKLLSLGDDLLVLPGHGPSTTIREERRGNPFLTGRVDPTFF